MVNGHELRIGNVISKDGKHLVVDCLERENDEIEITAGGLMGDGIMGYGDFFDPVPLTHEILGKYYPNYNSKEGIHLKNQVWIIIRELNWVQIKNNSAELRVRCESLHQFQNLVFALSGEELQTNAA